MAPKHWQKLSRAMAGELAEALREVRESGKRAIAQRTAQIRRQFLTRHKVSQTALRKFRPRKGDAGKIIFVSTKGKRIEGASHRRGFGVYVKRTGKKELVRQYDRKSKRLERVVTPKKLTTLDVTRVRSKRAKQEFITARLNPAVRGELTRKGKGISHKKTRFEGTIKTDKFYENSDSVGTIAKALVKAVKGTRSKRDFLVTIGVTIEYDGKVNFVEITRRFSRADGQPVTEGECAAFLGREVYAFLARELSARGLVLAGSARHIGRLKNNKGKPRDGWKKDGFLWEGHDMTNCKISKVEYRFDQLTLTS